MATLSILIPTYNRAGKLLRLLKTLEEEIRSSGLGPGVHVLVSDNASTDNTRDLCEGFSTDSLKFHYFRQEKNLGAVRNTWFLYNKATTDYVWFIADDDLPLPGSAARIAAALETQGPDVLIFSFRQPPDSTMKAFNYTETVKIVTAPGEIIDHMSRMQKISAYVLRKVAFPPEAAGEMEKYFDNDFFFLDLAFSVFEHSPDNSRLALISDFLATCDEDYRYVRVPLDSFYSFARVFRHPYVERHAPHLIGYFEDFSYYNAIQFLFAVKSGMLIAENKLDYDRAVRTIPVRWGLLSKRPRALLQLVVLKSGSVGLYGIYRKLRGGVAKFLRGAGTPG